MQINDRSINGTVIKLNRIKKIQKKKPNNANTKQEKIGGTGRSLDEIRWATQEFCRAGSPLFSEMRVRSKPKANFSDYTQEKQTVTNNLVSYLC